MTTSLPSPLSPLPGFVFQPTPPEIFTYFLPQRLLFGLESLLTYQDFVSDINLYENKTPEEIFEGSEQTEFYFFTKCKGSGKNIKREIARKGKWTSHSQTIDCLVEIEGKKRRVGSSRQFKFQNNPCKDSRVSWIMHEYLADKDYIKDVALSQNCKNINNGITMGNDEEPPQKTIAAAVDLDYYLGSGDGPGIVITPVKLRGASNYDEWAKAESIIALCYIYKKVEKKEENGVRYSNTILNKKRKGDCMMLEGSKKICINNDVVEAQHETIRPSYEEETMKISIVNGDDKEIMEANYAGKDIDETLNMINFDDFSSEIDDWDFNNKNVDYTTAITTTTTDDANFERDLLSEENKWSSYVNVQQFIETSSDFPTMDVAGFNNNNNNNNNNEDYVSYIEKFLLG
ncbi:NAC domain-containing protein 45-like [Spinacia oleracea]|uniref:NAC domain-containing protein 45-like n=1 Tax=Spinacia oleracea TaxID=3562 RepID=A0ABM3QWS6_SPIOL|nr:NAC domain-containing protein 45-like [Spinacia oleracea]